MPQWILLESKVFLLSPFTYCSIPFDNVDGKPTIIFQEPDVTPAIYSSRYRQYRRYRLRLCLTALRFKQAKAAIVSRSPGIEKTKFGSIQKVQTNEFDKELFYLPIIFFSMPYDK